MASSTSSIWDRPIPDLRNRLQACIDRGCDRLDRRTEVFFRADDIAVPGRSFTELMALFSEFETPMALALVPAWLTKARWRKLEALGCKKPELWSWHQHGWRHFNHEPAGKKSEFGPVRADADILHDLCLGRGRLKDLIGNLFFPVFTPPWNRCGPKTLRLLHELGFVAVSRGFDALPEAPAGLIELQVNVDLHTRKGKDGASDRRILFRDIDSAIGSGRCGFMLHHQRMNGAAFDFLKILLQVLADHPGVDVVGFNQLV
ncbi:MAG: polysaccharide deacetylase [Desulfobacteraceae bacterium]|nr:MAG: polysaccharide deacetylase [Desulfobacteraceae bacterium]